MSLSDADKLALAVTGLRRCLRTLQPGSDLHREIREVLEALTGHAEIVHAPLSSVVADWRVPK